MYARIAFTAFGVSDGFACSIRATTPVTAGAAMLVPLSEMYGKRAAVRAGDESCRV